MPTSSLNVLPNKDFSKQTLKLIANFRDIPEENTEIRSGASVAFFADILQKTLQQNLPDSRKSKTIDLLQTYWQDWFTGTDFVKGTPEKLDKWNCLWVKVPNAILRQKLQFKTDLFLNTINQFLPEEIKDVRWFI